MLQDPEIISILSSTKKTSFKDTIFSSRACPIENILNEEPGSYWALVLIKLMLKFSFWLLIVYVPSSKQPSHLGQCPILCLIKNWEPD